MGEPCVLLVGDRDEALAVVARLADHHEARETLKRRAPGALVRQRDGAVLEVRPGTRAHLALVERWVATHGGDIRGPSEASEPREVERVAPPAPRPAPQVTGAPVPSPDGIAAIIGACAHYFGLTKRALLGRSRVTHVVLARHLAMFLLRGRLGLSYPGLGAALGGLDHTSAHHAVRRIAEASRSGDPVVCRALREIPARLDGHSTTTEHCDV